MLEIMFAVFCDDLFTSILESSFSFFSKIRDWNKTISCIKYIIMAK